MVSSEHFFMRHGFTLDIRDFTAFRAGKTSTTNSSPGNTDGFRVDTVYFPSAAFCACTHIAPAKDERRAT